MNKPMLKIHYGYNALVITNIPILLPTIDIVSEDWISKKENILYSNVWGIKSYDLLTPLTTLHDKFSKFQQEDLCPGMRTFILNLKFDGDLITGQSSNSFWLDYYRRRKILTIKYIEENTALLYPKVSSSLSVPEGVSLSYFYLNESIDRMMEVIRSALVRTILHPIQTLFPSRTIDLTYVLAGSNWESLVLAWKFGLLDLVLTREDDECIRDEIKNLSNTVNHYRYVRRSKKNNEKLVKLIQKEYERAEMCTV